MMPAQQGFEPQHPVVDQLDQRLVVQVELVALERVTQIAFERHAFGQVVAQRDVEGFKAPAAELLGAVHRRVGVA